MLSVQELTMLPVDSTFSAITQAFIYDLREQGTDVKALEALAEFSELAAKLEDQATVADILNTSALLLLEKTRIEVALAK